MKIRLKEKGFESFTGFMGEVEFKDGVSVEDVPRMFADRIAAAMRTETVDGKEIGELARLRENKDMPAPDVISQQTKRDQEEAKEAKEEAKEEPKGDIVEEWTMPEMTWYTKEELGAIADEKGIEGLREIAEPLGVKGRAIIEIINGVVKKQEEVKAAMGKKG